MNSLIENSIKIMENAQPSNSIIKFYTDYAAGTGGKIYDDGMSLTIINDKKHVRFDLYKDDTKHLIIRTSRGSMLSTALNKKEYLLLQVAALDCINRFNEDIVTFYQNFYEH